MPFKVSFRVTVDPVQLLTPAPSHFEGRITKPKCHIPPLAADLMCGCLETDPELRFTIDQVRDHPWLSLSPRP
jgi:serine/threonine protein kinase